MDEIRKTIYNCNPHTIVVFAAIPHPHMFRCFLIFQLFFLDILENVYAFVYGKKTGDCLDRSYLETRKRIRDKQCRSKSDATSCGV